MDNYPSFWDFLILSFILGLLLSRWAVRQRLNKAEILLGVLSRRVAEDEAQISILDSRVIRLKNKVDNLDTI